MCVCVNAGGDNGFRSSSRVMQERMIMGIA